jgi:hypothetical protein
MTSKRSALAALAASSIALASLPAFAQTAPAPDPAQDAGPAIAPDTAAWASNLMASVTNEFDAMMEELGLVSPGVEMGLTPEMMAAALPQGGTPDDVGDLHLSTYFYFRDERTATAPPENPHDYVLATEPQGCLPAGIGEVVYFRTMALDGAVGHLCVVTVEDGAGLWGLRGRGLAVAGDLSVLVTYDMAVQMDGRPERARALGETAQEGAIQVSTVLADYTLVAAAVGQSRTTNDPVELARRVGRLLEQITAVVVTHLPPAATE